MDTSVSKPQTNRKVLTQKVRYFITAMCEPSHRPEHVEDIRSITWLPGFSTWLLLCQKMKALPNGKVLGGEEKRASTPSICWCLECQPGSEPSIRGRCRRRGGGDSLVEPAREEEEGPKALHVSTNLATIRPYVT